MQLRYLTQTTGRVTFTSKIGVAGVARATDNGVFTNPLAFECVVDNLERHADKWVVLLFLHPLTLDNRPGGQHTCVVLGSDGETPYDEFEAALAACKAISLNLYGRDVDTTWVNGLLEARQLAGVQWLDEMPRFVVVQEVGNPNTEIPDGEGDTCDVKKDGPRVLH